METFRQTLEDSLRTQIDEPMEDYLKQFDMMKKRVDERKRRLVDLDRYRQDYEKFMQKGGDMEETKRKQTKYLNMQKYFSELNEELKQDIPKLLSDRSNFYSPLFAMLIYHQLEYYKESFKASSVVRNSCSHIDPSSVHQHTQVITPEETSAHTMQINLDGPVDEHDDDLDSDSNPPPQQQLQPQQSYPPPQQNYPQQQYPPQQQNPPQQQYPPQQQNYPQQPNNPQKGLPPKKMGGPPPIKKVPPRQKQAQGLYPFQGQDSSELSFNAGDILIIHKDQGEWWEAELNGHRGVVPSNYVQLL